MERHVEIRVRTTTWMHLCRKATRGVNSSDKHSRKETQTRLRCVFNTPAELCLQLLETEEKEKLVCLSSAHVRTRKNPTE